MFTFNKYSVTCIFAGVYLIYGIGASTSLYANYLLLFLGILWAIVAAMVDLTQLVRAVLSPLAVIYSLFLIFYLLGILISDHKLLGIKYFGIYVLYLSIILIYEYYSGLKKDVYLKIVLELCFIGFIFFVVKALFFYSIHPGAARILAGKPEYYGNIMIGGGYQLAYLACIMCSYLILQLNIKNILLCILLGVLLIKTQSTITILITIIGIVLSLVYIFIRKFKRSDRIIIGFLLVFCIIIIFFLRDNIGELLVILSEDNNSSIMIRIREIGNLLRGQTIANESATMLRIVVYKDSLDIIINHPVFGEIFMYGVTPGLGSTGGHSDMLDAVARWGIMMGGLFLFPFCVSADRINKMKRWGYKMACLLLMLFNPCISFSFSAGIFFLIPSMEKMKKEK